MKSLTSILLCFFTTLSILGSESLLKKQEIGSKECTSESEVEIKALIGSLHNLEKYVEFCLYEDEFHADIVVRYKSEDFVDGENFSHPSLKWAQAKEYSLLMPYLRGYTGAEQPHADSDMPLLTQLIYDCMDYLVSLYDATAFVDDEDTIYPFEWLAENGYEELAWRVFQHLRTYWSKSPIQPYPMIPYERLCAAAAERRLRVIRMLLTISFGNCREKSFYPLYDLLNRVRPDDKIDEILSILKLFLEHDIEIACHGDCLYDCSFPASVAIAVEAGQPLEIILFLLNNGFPLDRPVDCSGMLLIHRAIEKSRIDVIDIILQRDPRQLEVLNKEGATPLLFAAAQDSGYIAADFLIEKGAHKDARDFNGNTFLLIAIKNSRESNVKYILKKGVHVTALNGNPLAWAMACANPSTVVTRDLAIELGEPDWVVLLKERDPSLPITMAHCEALFFHKAQGEEALCSTSSQYDIKKRSMLFGNMLTVFLFAQEKFLRDSSKTARVKMKTALLCLARYEGLPREIKCKILLGALETELGIIFLDALKTKRPMDEKALPLSKEIVSRLAVAFADRLIKILKEKGDERSMSSICQPAEFFSPIILEVVQARAEQLKRVDLEEAPNIMGVGHVARQM